MLQCLQIWLYLYFLPCINSQGIYQAYAKRLRTTPLISPLNSIWSYSYNPSIFIDSSTNRIGMLVRVQNQTTSNPYDIGPSQIAFTYFINDGNFTEVYPLTLESLVLSPTSSNEDGCGDEDPRAMINNNNILFITYTAYTCSQPNLALATVAVKDATNVSAYIRHGTLFQNSKSGSILFNSSINSPSIMLYGGGIINAASSQDGGYTWSDLGPFLQPRSSLFDSELVEGGPMPLPLSDGKTLFYLYNSDTSGPTTRKPNWNTIYNCGFAILNASEPTHVLQRSNVALFSPELSWEMDESGLLTPNVVFCEGLVPKPNTTDTFIFVYGAGDSFVGVGEITVFVPPLPVTLNLTRLLTHPILSNASGTSTSSYIYSPGLYQRSDGSIVMLPRGRNITDSSNPYTVGSSAIFSSILIGPNWTSATPVFGLPVLAPLDTDDFCGCEDARVVYSKDDETFFITYNGIECDTGNAKIMLATAINPEDATSYLRLGPIFPQDANNQWSKAGALLLRDSPPYYLFHGDNSDQQGIHVAISVDRINWERTNLILLVTRSDGINGNTMSFDAAIVEPGPPPVLLSDGNLLFLYAGGRGNVPSPRPSWNAYYCIGYTILNGSNPIQILERSFANEPLMCPELSWEIGANGQYPNRINVNGIVPIVSTGEEVERIENKKNDLVSDLFLLAYSAADTSIGVATLKVTKNEKESDSNIRKYKVDIVRD
jgi:predicted GH43/DUF377 family glycosyl hydrolase